MLMTTAQIQALHKKIEEADRAYRAGEDSGMTDAEYDRLLKVLEDVLKRETAIEQRKETDTIPHIKKMYSISNVYGRVELLKWLNRLATDGINVDTIDVEPFKLFYDVKVDGLACALLYSNGNLVGATTRGDGEYGTNILDKVLCISNIPTTIPNLARLEIYGEIFITRTNLKRANAIRKEQQETKYSTCRSAAAGIINNKVAREETKLLDFFAYGLSTDIGTSEENKILELRSYGFYTPHYDTCTYDGTTKSLDKLWAFYDGRNSTEREVPADGVVVKLDSYVLQQRLGYTNKYPKFYKAWKFTDSEYTTTVLDFIYQVSRYGRIIPVIQLEPIVIDDTTISKVTAISETWVQENKIAKQVEVSIVKSGGVIPKVQEVTFIPMDNPKYKRLTHCPVCNSPVELIGRDTVCTNRRCKGMLVSLFAYMVSKNGLDIKGIGEKTIEQLVDSGRLKIHSDIFKIEEWREMVPRDIPFYKYINSISSGITKKSMKIIQEQFSDKNLFATSSFLNQDELKKLKLGNTLDKAKLKKILDEINSLGIIN